MIEQKYFTSGKTNFRVQAFSEKAGFAGTVIFWIVLAIVLFFIPTAQKKPVYKTVQIHLAASSSKPVVSTPAPVAQSSVKENAAVAKSNDAKTESSKSASPEKKSAPLKKSATVEKASSSSAAKKNPVQSSKTPAVQKIQKSVEELMAENNSAKKKQAVWDESAFADSETQTSSSVNMSKGGSSNSDMRNVNALEGTAASASDSDKNPATSSSSRNTQKNSEAGVSTKNMLGKIAATSYTQYSQNGVSMSATANTGTDPSGNVSLQMDDGAARALINPKTPVINLSDEVARTIDSKKDVEIKFDVTAGGNVPVTGIIISPASSFTPAVQKEIRDQISRWLFSQSAVPGKATIHYSVKPRD